METFNKKILIIGIDGATWSILDEVLEKGYMPYLKSLKENGAHGILRSTIPPLSPSAWGTIQTGRDAINNHIYEFYSFDKITKKVKLVNSNFLKNTVWDILSSVGKKVAVVNIPLTYPPKKVNGFIISGIMTPSLESNFTYPSDLKQKILQKIPNYQLKYIEEKKYGNPIVFMKNFVKHRIENVKDRTKACLYLLHNNIIDILMVNFQANDILQHSLWGYIERSHKLYDENVKGFIYSNFHKNLDFCIETLVEEYKRYANGKLLTIILSDHGFESHLKQFYLGDWLYRLNLLKIKRGSIKSIIRRKIREFIEKLTIQSFQVKILRLLKSLSNMISTVRSPDKRSTIIDTNLDLENSKVYSSGISLYGYIFIFPEGKERLQIINLLKKKLYNLEDSETGLKIVKKVFTREEIYKGDHPHLIPDLIIQPSKGYSFTGMYKGKKKLIEKITLKESESIGKHNEEGIIIVNGSSITKKKIEKASLRDITPTILRYFDLPLKDDLDGKVLDCLE
ncbi:MAG: alkaline phosphatase family protein [Candidatus Hodarchaeota archaeon]